MNFDFWSRTPPKNSLSKADEVFLNLICQITAFVGRTERGVQVHVTVVVDTFSSTISG